MRGMASHVSTLCKRFASILRKCDGEFYVSMGKLLPEIAPMERRLDMHIDTLRREEFRFLECGSDVQKFVCCVFGLLPFTIFLLPVVHLVVLGCWVSSNTLQRLTLPV